MPTIKKTYITIDGVDIDLQYDPASIQKRIGVVHTKEDELGSQTVTIGRNNTLTASVDFFMTAEFAVVGGKSPADFLASAGLAALNSVAGEFVQNARRTISTVKGVYDQVSGVVGLFKEKSKNESAARGDDNYKTLISNIKVLEQASVNGSFVRLGIDVLKLDHNDKLINYFITGIQTQVEALSEARDSIVVKIRLELQQVETRIRIGEIDR